MKSGIYSIASPSGKCYIGSAANIARRWGVHLRALRSNCHQNSALQRACDKYGIDALCFTVIERCEISELLEREQFHINSYAWDWLYNISPTAGGGAGPHTPETRARMSKARRGIVYSPETRARMATAARARAPAAPETRAKRAVANLGRTRSPETRAKMGAARLDPGPETRAKMAAARMATAARKRNKTGGVLGVYPTRNGTWRSLIRNGGEYRHIGTYSTQTLARAMRFVYLEAWPYREPS